MADEGVVLDDLDLNSATGGIWVLTAFDAPPPKKRLDWAQADSDGAALAREPRFENRTITISLEHRAAATSMDEAMATIAMIVDKLEECSRHDDGLPLVWTPAGSTESVTFDILVGEITGLPITIDSGWFSSAPSLTLELIAKPFWRGESVSIGEVTSTGPILTTTIGPIAGDAPSDAQLIVRDVAGVSRDDVEWGLEQRFFNADTPSSLVIDSASFVLNGIAAANTRAGAFASIGVAKATLPPIPALICSLGDQPHVGTFRVKARVWCDSTAVFVRLAWRDGDGPLFSNNWASPQSTGTFAEIDLGQITIAEAAFGSQRWSGQIEAYSQIIGNANLEIDYLMLIPAGEGYGRATAPAITDRVLLVAQDSFNQASGALAGKAMGLGGTWAAGGGAGSGTDFQVQPAFGLVSRVAASDGAALNQGRIDLAGSTVLTGTDMTYSFQGDPLGNNVGKYGLVARFVDGSNFVVAFSTMISTGSGGTPPNVGICYLTVQKVVGGAVTALNTSPQFNAISQWSTLRFWIDNSGRFAAIRDIKPANFAPLHVCLGQDADLATGGVLASGKVGIYDQNTSAGTSGRFIDDFQVSSFDRQPVLYANRTLRITNEDVQRENALGYYGRPPSYRGARFRLPPGGDQNRTTRIAVKARRNVTDEFPDVPINDGIGASVVYEPRGLAVPRPTLSLYSLGLITMSPTVYWPLPDLTKHSLIPGTAYGGPTLTPSAVDGTANEAMLFTTASMQYLSSASAVGNNLILNPSALVDLYNWTTAVTNATVNSFTRSTTWQANGSFYFKATGTGTGSAYLTTRRTIKVTPGVVYTARVAVNVLQKGTNGPQLLITVLNAANTTVMVATSAPVTAVGEDTVVATFRAPSTATQVIVSFGNLATFANTDVSEFYAHKFQLSENSPVVSRFDVVGEAHEDFTTKGTSAITTADTGQTWIKAWTNGTLQSDNGPTIISGKFTKPTRAVGASYIQWHAGDTVRRLRGRFTFDAKTTNTGALGMLVFGQDLSAVNPFLKSNAHIVFSPDGILYQVIEPVSMGGSGLIETIPGGSVLFNPPLAADDTTVHDATVLLDTVGGAAQVSVSNGQFFYFRDPRIATLADRYATFEVVMNTATTDTKSKFTEVWASTAAPESLPVPTYSNDYKSLKPFVSSAVFTWVGWVWRDNTSAPHAMFGSSAISGAGCLFYLQTGSQNIIWSPRSGTAPHTMGVFPGNGQWVHIALIDNRPANTSEVFIDGVSQGVKSITDAYDATPGIYLAGGAPESQFLIGNGLSGRLDEVALFQRALSAAEIARLARP